MYKPISSVRKFYLLEYFFVLLKSIERSSDKDQIFEHFKALKYEYQLGESKYKKITIEPEKLSKNQIVKYRYTFRKVLEESIEYGLVKEENENIFLLSKGKNIIDIYENSFEDFAYELCQLMESKYNAFRSLIELMYKENRLKNGLFIFPVYSPLQLGLERSGIKTTEDIVFYSNELKNKIEKDISDFLSEEKNLSSENLKLIDLLINDKLISKDHNSIFDPNKYNAIILRFRDYWLKYFLKEIYHFEFSLSSFEIWTYRARQIGIIHATEFYPFFNGKVVFPTSVISASTNSSDFLKINDYPDGKSLFIHRPEIGNEKNQELFIDEMINAYYLLRRSYRSYFINLSALKEIVCFKLRISGFIFQNILDSVYKDNLRGGHKIKISLEVDRLPEETKATYLKREPVLVNGKFRNIIAIDVA